MRPPSTLLIGNCSCNITFSCVKAPGSYTLDGGALSDREKQRVPPIVDVCDREIGVCACHPVTLDRTAWKQARRPLPRQHGLDTRQPGRRESAGSARLALGRRPRGTRPSGSRSAPAGGAVVATHHPALPPAAAGRRQLGRVAQAEPGRPSAKSPGLLHSNPIYLLWRDPTRDSTPAHGLPACPSQATVPNRARADGVSGPVRAALKTYRKFVNKPRRRSATQCAMAEAVRATLMRAIATLAAPCMTKPRTGSPPRTRSRQPVSGGFSRGGSKTRKQNWRALTRITWSEHANGRGGRI
jgi:hypothetical protein